MQRRDFVRTTIAASAASGVLLGAAQGKVPLAKREYKDGVMLSVIGFGGMVVVGQEQDAANQTVANAVNAGINYFDVAPSYGDGEAEEKLGPALEPHRKNAFLACKTTERKAAGAQRELEQSLRRMRTDYFDLYQFHAVSSMDDVEQILGPGGAAELFTKAKKEGKLRYLGFSAHNAEAAIALMDRMPLDSVLFPVNYVNYQQGHFGPQILAHAKTKGLARLALKAMAITPWPANTPRDNRPFPNCWYKPASDLASAKNGLRFTLSEDVTSAIPPGDHGLFEMAVSLAQEFRPMGKEEREELLAGTAGVEPLFKA